MENHSGPGDSQKDSKILSALSKISAAIARSGELDPVLDLISNGILEVLRFDRVGVYVVDSEKGILRGRACADTNKEDYVCSFSLGEKKALKPIETQTYPLKEGVNEVVDVFLRKDFTPSKSADKLSCYLPLIGREEKIGLIAADNIRSRRQISEEDEDLLRTMANQASLAITVSGLYEKVKELSIRDPLTGFYVCGHFLERLDEEIKRSGRAKQNFSLMIVDVDGFRRYNDVHGHLIGDRIIRFLSGILKRKLRAVDLKTRSTSIMGRCGGDEFIILLVGAPLDSALLAADRVKDAVRAERLKIDDNELSFTVSIGIAEFPSNGTSGPELFKKTCEALFEAKKFGKDRTCSVKDIGKLNKPRDIF